MIGGDRKATFCDNLLIHNGTHESTSPYSQLQLFGMPEELMDHWPKLRIGFTGAITFRDRDKGDESKRHSVVPFCSTDPEVG